MAYQTGLEPANLRSRGRLYLWSPAESD